MSFVRTLFFVVIVGITLNYLTRVDSAGIKFVDCSTHKNTVTEVAVENCSAEPCVFKHKTTQNMTINFTAMENSTTAVAQVYGIVNGVEAPFPGGVPDPNACDGKSNIKCPIEAGKKYSYKHSIYVSPLFPTLKVVVKWTLIDAKGNYIFCFELPAQIAA